MTSGERERQCAGQTPEPLPVIARRAALASFLLGFAGLAYWIPALFGAPAGVPESDSPMAFIQRVAAMALEQYTPQMRGVVPALGVLFSAASALQIPLALGTLLNRRGSLVWLAGVAYVKLGLYIASGLLLGLALFSVAGPGEPSWSFSAGNWAANLVMIAIYYWLITALRTGREEGPAGEAVTGENGAESSLGEVS